MLRVASASDAVSAGGAFATDVDAAALLNEAFGEQDGGGTTSTEHSRDFGGDDVADEKATVKKKRFSFVETVTTSVGAATSAPTVEQEVDEANDSDYYPEEEEEDDDDEEEEAYADDEDDDDAYLQSLDAQLDEHADEVGDYYLKRMLEKRATLDGDEAQWVDSYIARQRKWKETHGTSIDEMDLDLLRPVTETTQLHAVWNGRVAPWLPLALREQPAEFLLSLVAVALFVGVALAVQFYVAFKAPLSS